MDVSGEAADLVVKESIQATESAVRLAGSGLKNVAALLLALSQQNFKVVGETSAKRMAQENAPAVVISLKKEDMGRFQQLAKEYGVLYFLAQKKGNESGLINVVSNQNYAAQLNVIMEAMHYPIPQRTQADEQVKKATPRAPQERSSPERENGLNHSPAMPEGTKKPSVKKRLEHLKATQEQTRGVQEKIKGKTR